MTTDNDSGNEVSEKKYRFPYGQIIKNSWELVKGNGPLRWGAFWAQFLDLMILPVLFIINQQSTKPAMVDIPEEIYQPEFIIKYQQFFANAKIPQFLLIILIIALLKLPFCLLGSNSINNFIHNLDRIHLDNLLSPNNHSLIENSGRKIRNKKQVRNVWLNILLISTLAALLFILYQGVFTVPTAIVFIPSLLYNVPYFFAVIFKFINIIMIHEDINFFDAYAKFKEILKANLGEIVLSYILASVVTVVIFLVILFLFFGIFGCCFLGVMINDSSVFTAIIFFLFFLIIQLLIGGVTQGYSLINYYLVYLELKTNTFNQSDLK